jgi:hypothetical protein
MFNTTYISVYKTLQTLLIPLNLCVTYDDSANIPEHVRTVVHRGTINTHTHVPEWLLFTTMSLMYKADHKPN